MTTTAIEVGGPDPYEVRVGSAITEELGELIPDDVVRVAVIHPAALTDRADRLRGQLVERGMQVLPLVVPDGEAAKTADVAEHCWGELGAAGFTRSDLVVGLGGGATTDLAGFVAAAWLRGVRVVHLPTTLLGMVDAAIGGKTGINTAAGKNLVGAFHSPALVLCDLDSLRTMTRPDYASGLAEIIKAGFIRDPAVLDLIADDPEGAMTSDGRHTRELVVRAIQVKADVVSLDPTEAGEREILNYGHTLAHAIERREDYRWRHGDAVSVGLVFAAALAHADGRIPSDLVELHRTLLTDVDLPVTYPAEAWPELHETMRVDKKARGRRLRFVVLDALARPARLDDPAADLLAAAYEEVAQ
jgi:3-dehydroquinate synthase